MESLEVPIKREGSALRFNQNKMRLDLISPLAIKELALVLENGAKKYGDNNWRKGMPWTQVIASLKRHLHSFESGEDRDPESGLLHLGHAMCNIMFLIDYYQSFPQGDDRFHHYLLPRKISLDIDEVLADWIKAWMEKRGMEERPTTWFFDEDQLAKISELSKDKDFWMSIQPLLRPCDLPFEPHCYITHRFIPKEWTTEWLKKHGFPIRTVYNVESGQTKASMFERTGADWHVDDNYDTFVEMSKRGFCCWLYTAPHNTKYDVGFKRIHTLRDLPL